jgi:hypothetical protein
MLCMRNQVVEGHMIDFEIDRIESESDQKILGKEKLDTKENEQIQHALVEENEHFGLEMHAIEYFSQSSEQFNL